MLEGSCQNLRSDKEHCSDTHDPQTKRQRDRKRSLGKELEKRNKCAAAERHKK